MFDVLVTTIDLIMAMEFQLNFIVDRRETCDQFDVEFQMLNKNLRQEVVKLIKPFVTIFDGI